MKRLFEITWHYIDGDELRTPIKADNIYSAVQLAHMVADLMLKVSNCRLTGFEVNPIEE